MLGTKIKIFFITSLLLACSFIARGQNPSSSNNSMQQEALGKVHSPHKATIYSALVPGLGQIYNKKYWKLPVIYGATGILIYAFDFNNDEYNRFKTAYAKMDAGEIDSYLGYTDKEIILRIKDNYDRNRTLNVISLAAVYLLNIVDATVDAHLFNYQINDDLSLNVQPAMRRSIDYQNAYGLAIRVSF